MSKITLEFTRGGVPEVESGSMATCIVMTRNAKGGGYTMAAYYLNAYPLQYDECKCKESHDNDSECPTTGWFYDQSNLEYENCYYAINAEIVAWAEIPSAADVNLAFVATEQESSRG